MSALKVHWAIVRRVHGEDRARSLCNRSAPSVINVATLDYGQNLTTDPKKITCSFCLSMIKKRPSLIIESAR